MKTMSKIRRFIVSGVVVMAAAAVPAISSTAQSPAASAADDEPPLTLRASSKSVTVWKYGKWADLDLGTYAVAGSQPFEVRATRTSYAKRIKGVVKREGGDLKLPQGSVKAFRGLRDFYRLTIKNKDGKKVLDKTKSFCPDAESVRVDPDAPANSPYPLACGGRMPFTLGNVWGVQAGHGIPIPPAYTTRAKLPVGKYSTTVAITKKYRKALGIAKSQGVVTLTMRVRKTKDCDRYGCREHRHSHHAGDIAKPGERPTGVSRIPESGPVPDLRSVPAWGIRVRKGKYLAFSATVWNAGDSPLVVDGFRRKNKDLMDAYQYFFDADGNQTGYDKVGTMEWDPREDHHHWHFTDFARYRLVDADKKGIVRSKKEAFCLANTDAVDYTVEGANWQPDNTDLHTACGEKSSLGLREVLDSGNGDTYEQFRPGQSFVLKNIPNGTYYIEVRANPIKNLTESDTSNNVTYRKVILGGKPGARTVKVPPVGLIDHK
ncbi:lysyl oxidase family protein [Nocardioidaceae bacterium SCSIO 66511]|nr:lysyl oxidase family protein [Nocardioidaceae bacterium SCSIO 66511]